MEESCASRIQKHWDRVEADIRRMLVDANEEYEGEFSEYGLGFDYVEPGTFEDQTEGYYRYQMSWGGPSDEIRFHDDGRAEYWFMDWFDGACIDVTGNDAAEAVRSWFEDIGVMEEH